MGVRVVDKTELLAMLANVSDYGRFHWTNQKLVDCITRVLENEGVKKDPPLCCVLQKRIQLLSKKEPGGDLGDRDTEFFDYLYDLINQQNKVVASARKTLMRRYTSCNFAWRCVFVCQMTC